MRLYYINIRIRQLNGKNYSKKIIKTKMKNKHHFPWLLNDDMWLEKKYINDDSQQLITEMYRMYRTKILDLNEEFS